MKIQFIKRLGFMVLLKVYLRFVMLGLWFQGTKLMIFIDLCSEAEKLGLSFI